MLVKGATCDCIAASVDERTAETVMVKFGLGPAHTNTDIVNPLRAKFFRENVNIYLHFMSFLHIN